MKILALVSSLDLRMPFSSTPAWWQLLKALSEIGCDIIAVPYAGRAVETPWWRAEENPCLAERARVLAGVAPGAVSVRQADEGIAERVTRRVAQSWVRPRWERHIARILERERDIHVVVVFTLPLNHLTGMVGALTRRYGVPFFYYDGDVPASLPSFAGFQSGFRIYQGADPGEYEAFFSNSKGGGKDLLALGAKRVHTLYYGVDPQIFAPAEIRRDLDVFFYGHGHEYRREWVDAMLTEPSKVLPEAQFAIRGSGFDDIDLGRTQRLPYMSVGKLREYCNRSKLNLLINRQAHASVYASSTSRPFELAAMRCCMLSNPYAGIEEWFEPGKEVILVDDPAEATGRIRWLLDNPDQREAIAEAAYRRVLRQHTFHHRARDLVQALSVVA
jgi:glycosyltransferase involved in cell wall biosynthesis